MVLPVDDPLYQIIDAEQRRREQADTINASNPNIPSDLGSYRGIPVQSSDPNFRARQEALTALREAELARMQGMSNATRADSLNAIQQAGLLASAGGIASGHLPDSSPYVNVYNSDYARNLGLTNTRLKGSEDDEGRVSNYIRNAYTDTKDIEKSDYDRRQKEIENRRAEEQLGISKERFGLEKEKLSRELNNPELVGVTQDGNKTIWRNPKTGEYMTGDGKVANAEDLLSMRGVGTKKDEYSTVEGANGQMYVFNKSTGRFEKAQTGTGESVMGAPKGQLAGLAAKDEAGMLDSASRAQQTIEQINNYNNAIEKIGKGILSPKAGPLDKEIVAGLGGVNQILGTNILDTKERQEAMAFASQLEGMASEMLKGQGQITEGERRIISDSMGKLTDPATAKIVTGILKENALRTQQMAKEWLHGGRQSGKDFYTWRQEWMEKNAGGKSSTGGVGGNAYGGITGNTTTSSVNSGNRTIVKTGTYNGRPVVQYSDGTVEYK